MTVLLVIIAAVLAVGDWVAVHQQLRSAELALKPLTLAALLAVAASAHLGDAKPWVLIALGLGLIGDVALLAPDAPPEDGPQQSFLVGLGAFLLGHVAWIVAFTTRSVHGVAFLAGLLVAVALSGVVLGPVLRAAGRIGGPPFAGIVAVYAAVLGLAAAFAAGTGAITVAIGGVLFLVSDSVLARGRFVGPIRNGPVIVIVTYHLAQALMLLGLAHSL